MPQLFVPCPGDVSDFLDFELGKLAASASRFGLSFGDGKDAAAIALIAGGTTVARPAIRLVPSPVPGEISITEEIGGEHRRLRRLAANFASGLDEITCHAAFSSCPEPPKRDEAAPSDEHGFATLSRDVARRCRATEVLFNSVPAEPEAVAMLIADGVAALERRTPDVSIVINNYNYDRFLGQAIESALHQTRPPRDIVVVDDGSQDGSRELLKGYRGIRTICKPNGGQASAFNAGFAAAEGDLIVFLDADDMLAPDAVERLSREDPRTFARLSFCLETMDAGGAPTGLFPMSRAAASGEVKGPLLSEGTLRFMPTSGNAFPRATLERLLPMPEARWRISADVFLAYGAALLGPAKHLDVALGRYRLHGANNYYQPFGSDAPFARRKIFQRLAAFGDLVRMAERDGTLVTDGELARLRRLAEPGSMAARIGSWQRARLEPRRDLTMPPLAAGKRERPPRGGLATHLRTRSPALFAGKATWPLVKPGMRLDLSDHVPDTPLGSGWRAKPGVGAVLTGEHAVIAVRFPGPRADWVLHLAYSPVDGATLDLWINGMRHEALRLDEAGWAEIRVAGAVLELDPVSRTWRAGITLVPEAGAEVTVASIEVRRVCATQFGAPVLRDRAVVTPDSAIGHRMLANGWDWPDAQGAAMLKPEAFLRFTVAERGAARLLMSFSRPPLLISIAGTAVPTQPDVSGRGVVVRLGPAEVPFSGIVDMGIVATGALDRPVLEAIRLLSGPVEEGALPEGALTPVSELACRSIAADTLAVTWTTPVSGSLFLRFDADRDVRHGRIGVRLGDVEVGIELAGDALVALNAPDPLFGVTVRLPETVALASIGHEATAAGQDAVPSDTSLEALSNSADDPRAWRLAEGEALWLTRNRSRLRLPPAPAGSTHLRLVALALAELGQVLRVRHGGHVAQTGGAPGQQILDIPVQSAAGPDGACLDVETNLLVHAARIGLEDDIFLGGAIVGATFVSLTDQDRQFRERDRA